MIGNHCAGRVRLERRYFGVDGLTDSSSLLSLIAALGTFLLDLSLQLGELFGGKFV